MSETTAVEPVAGDAAAAEPAAVLEGLQPPKGMIIPPRGEIREAIEKTAGYVMRGGVGLEERIRGNHGTNPKFSFLMSAADPYNAYYEWRKAEIKAGRGTAVSAGRTAAVATTAAPAATTTTTTTTRRWSDADNALLEAACLQQRMSNKAIFETYFPTRGINAVNSQISRLGLAKRRREGE